MTAGLAQLQDKEPVVSTGEEDILPEEALLLWLKVHSFRELGKFSSAALSDTLAALWPDVVASTRKSQVLTDTVQAPESKPNIITRLISSVPDHINVSFVHQLDPKSSTWVLSHEDGRKYMQTVLGPDVTVRNYFNANSPEETDKLLEEAVRDGAQVIFTTAPVLNRSTLKAAVKYP